MPKTSAELHADKVACLLNWRCSYAAWDGDEHGDTVLIALLSNHFGGDLEAMLSLIHARAEKTKLKAMRIGETIDLDRDTVKELERKADERQHAEPKVERPKRSQRRCVSR